MNLTQVLERLNSGDNAVNILGIDHRRVFNGQRASTGRRIGSPNLPVYKRVEAAITVKNEGAEVAAERYGISEGYAKALGSGFVGGRPSPELKEAIKEASTEVNDMKTQIKDAALTKLMLAVGLIDEDAVKKLGPVNQATVAEKMAAIVDKLEPKKEQVMNVNTGVIFYSPAQKSEDQYPTKFIDIESGG